MLGWNPPSCADEGGRSELCREGPLDDALKAMRDQGHVVVSMASYHSDNGRFSIDLRMFDVKSLVTVKGLKFSVTEVEEMLDYLLGGCDNGSIEYQKGVGAVAMKDLVGPVRCSFGRWWLRGRMVAGHKF